MPNILLPNPGEANWGAKLNTAVTVVNAAVDAGGTGLALEGVQDAVAAMVIAGANITKFYDDPAGTLTISSTAGAPILSVLSTTSNSVSSGNKTFTVAAHSFTVGMNVRAFYSPSGTSVTFTYVEGAITAVTATTVTFVSVIFQDTMLEGPYARWYVQLQGETGAVGPLGPVGASPMQFFTFLYDGNVTVNADPMGYILPNVNCRIKEVVAYAAIPAVGGPGIIVDINVNSATIFTNQTLRPIAKSGPAPSWTGAAGAAIDFAVPLRGIVTCDIDQVGSTTAGGKLTVTVGFVQA